MNDRTIKSSNQPNSSLRLPRYCIVPFKARIDKTLSDAAKIYLGEISELVRYTGYCEDSDEELAVMKQVSISTIKNWHRELESRGFILRETSREHIKYPEQRGVQVRTRRKIYIAVHQLDADPNIYNRSVAKSLGSIKAAILLSLLVKEYNLFNDVGKLHSDPKNGDNWFVLTTEKCQEETSLSRKEQDRAFTLLEERNLFEKRNIGVPPRRHFRLNLHEINTLLKSSSYFP